MKSETGRGRRAIAGAGQLPERHYPCAMSALAQKTLKVVPAPLVAAAAIKAPPVLKALDPTVEYRCGGCGVVLISALRAMRTIQRADHERVRSAVLGGFDQLDAQQIEVGRKE
jgi:hypothetical protein